MSGRGFSGEGYYLVYDIYFSEHDLHLNLSFEYPSQAMVLMQILILSYFTLFCFKISFVIVLHFLCEKLTAVI